MSNVLMRKRSISDLEFWKTGSEIRAALTRFLMNENNVPKRWRRLEPWRSSGSARRRIAPLSVVRVHDHRLSLRL